jgi:protein SCO1/2
MNGRGFQFGVVRAAVFAAVAACASGSASGQATGQPRELEGLELVSRNGEQVPLDAVLMNDAGEMVRLGDYFNDGPLARTHDGRGKPAIMALVYYDCPIVCPLTMERLRQAMNEIDYIVGEDFNVLVVSIDHTNTPEMSLREKTASLLAYNRRETPAVRAGWAYHTASAGNIQRIADAVGFEFNLIEDAGEYAHAPGIILLTPEGRVARYIDGLNYVEQASDIQLGLVEASQGQISATLMDRLMMWCYDFDPQKGSYTLQAKRVMQGGGVLSMTGIAGLVLVLRAGEKRRARRRAGAAPPTSADASGRPAAPSTSQGFKPSPT